MHDINISTHQQNNSFEYRIRSISNDVQYVINQLFKLLRRDLVEDPADPSKYHVIMKLFFVLGKCVSSNRAGGRNPS